MAEPRSGESTPGLPTVGLGSPARGSDVERIEGGLSMKARARVMIATAFLLALPALLLGALRASVATDDVKTFTQASQTADVAHSFELRVQATRAALWAFEAERNVDTGRRLRTALDAISRAVLELDQHLISLRDSEVFADVLASWRAEVSQGSEVETGTPLSEMRAAVGRVRRNVDPLIDDRDQASDTAALRRAHVALETLSRDAATLVKSARNLTQTRAKLVDRAVSLVGRDQVVLFLLLLFAAPLLAGFGPGWMIAPLVRLRGVSQRIERGRVREIVPSGRDEVGDVTRALRSALSRLDEADRMRRAKIFELRRVLRAVIAPLSECIIIVGRGGKVDYVNAAAASLLGRESHNIENLLLEELMHSPELMEAIRKAREGDVEEKGVGVMVETEVRVERLHANLTPVRNQEGLVTRVVLVLRR